MSEKLFEKHEIKEDSLPSPITGVAESMETISFIIPALNEEKNISRAIRSIQECMGDSPHEIIVVDNGSHDNTPKIAASIGANVIVDKTKTIGGLRNLGYENSKGSIIAFIDSDIELDSRWFEELRLACKNWPEDRLIVTGSSYRVSEDSTFIEKHWFSKFSVANVSYINSGHMITTRTLIDLLGGFDESLKTSEDFDLCQRAKKLGGVVRIEPKLKAYHHGFPTTIRDFVVREAWHGKADISSLRQFLNSKTAIASVGNSILLATAFLSFFLFDNLWLGISILSISFLFCMLSTYIKFGADSLTGFLKTAACFEVYFSGRTLSIFIGKSRPKARAS